MSGDPDAFPQRTPAAQQIAIGCDPGGGGTTGLAELRADDRDDNFDAARSAWVAAEALHGPDAVHDLGRLPPAPGTAMRPLGQFSHPWPRAGVTR